MYHTRVLSEGLGYDFNLRLDFVTCFTGEISKNLESLYDYVVRRLFHANLKSDIGALEESEMLLGEIRTGWTEMTKLQKDA